MPWNRSKTRKLAVGLAFIGPNVAGFLVFILFPLTVSFLMAFTNWDLRLHNMFRDEPVRFIAFENFVRLFAEDRFGRYLGNTLFLMMGIPLSVAGSLMAALLLSQTLRGNGRGVWTRVALTAVLLASSSLLVLVGMGGTAMTVLIAGLAGAILVGGALGGQTVYRTLFYFPHFTAGVATFLLWKKLYNPYTGPINTALQPLLDSVAAGVRAVPAELLRSGLWGAALLSAIPVVLMALRIGRDWRDGEAGWVSVLLGTVVLLLPAAVQLRWNEKRSAAVFGIAAACVAAAVVAGQFRRPRAFVCVADKGLGRVLISCGALLVLQLGCLGLGNVLNRLPQMAADGLNPPEWLTQYHWAKPSLMLMGLWAAVGSNNMLLYLAGLSNVPQELYEAADIDGASRPQRFWHVTWPQLAPVTFFILVMAIIGGLQGGFEMARTMTRGGPAGATTTLSYFIYTEGFENGRLGYASAAAWVLFALVFAVTMFNWRFGNRYTND